MEVLGNFGINPILLVAQTVNFLIIFYLVKRFALKPILTLLKNREKTIKDGLQQAEDARILFERASEKERELLRNAQREAQELLSSAKSEREEMLQENEVKTQKLVEKMLSEAREQISAETKEAEKRLSSNIAMLAREMLEKSVEELFSEKEQRAVLNHALKKVEKKLN